MYLKQTVAKAGLCSDNQRDRFTRSANTAEIAGKDASFTGQVRASPESYGPCRSDFLRCRAPSTLRCYVLRQSRGPLPMRSNPALHRTRCAGR